MIAPLPRLGHHCRPTMNAPAEDQMPGRLLTPKRGALVLTIMITNTLVAASLIILLLPLRFLPGVLGQRYIPRLMTWNAENWASFNNRVAFRMLPRIDWDIRYPEGLSTQGWYMIAANHQSWVDTLVLFYVFNRRIPFLKYFLKQDLIWIPFLGAALWCMDFPFMRRYSKAYLAKHPEMKGKDVETTRKSCARFRHMPVSVINFPEGTRITPEKHAEQASPYHHLLKPKAGGMAFALLALGDRMRCLLDVTLIYPDGVPSMWDFACGRTRRITVLIEQREIPADCFSRDYETDPEFRQQFQDWIGNIWAEKDALLAQNPQGTLQWP